MKMIFLVDGDNNIGTGLAGVEMLSEDDVVMIFHQKRAQLAKIKAQCAKSKADVQFVPSVKSGKNSIDFQIIAELGVLVGKSEVEYAYVISQDKGYEASIEALNQRHADAFREVALRGSIEDCIPLPFVLQSQTKDALHSSLVKEYGSAKGSLLYNHLKQIFSATAG